MVLQFQEVRNTLLIIISECSSLRGSFDCFLALLTDFQLVLAPLPSPVEICLDISTRTSFEGKWETLRSGGDRGAA